MPGFARFIVIPSLHAAEFGVGTTVMLGSMLVPPSSATAGRIVPDSGLPGISGVESGKAAPFVGGPPGVVLHTVVDEAPTGDAGAVVPIVVTTIGEKMVPNGLDDIAVVEVALPAVDAETVLGSVGTAGIDGIVPASPIPVMEVTGIAGVPDTISPVGMAQVTTVPGVAGSETDGTGASVVPGVPGRVVAENGPGP
jgi:hypothetical protein